MTYQPTNVYSQPKSSSSVLYTLSNKSKTFPKEIIFVWIGLLIQGKGKSFPEILQVRTNCVTATFKDNDNELSHLIKGLPEIGRAHV